MKIDWDPVPLALFEVSHPRSYSRWLRMSSAEAFWTLAGCYIWMWQKVTSSLDWYFLASCQPCEAIPSPCDIKWQNHIFLVFSPPLSAVSSKGQPDILKVCYFASADTCCFGSFVLEVPCKCFFSFFFSYLHYSRYKGAHRKLVILHLFIWTFSFHCNTAHWMLRYTFIRKWILQYISHSFEPVPEFHTEETWQPPTARVWCGSVWTVFQWWTHYIFFC